MVSRSSFSQLVGRALRLRCPVCGEGKLFRGIIAINENCPNCEIKIEREPGFFLGAIYFNYGLTAMLTLIAYALLRFTTELTSKQVLGTTLAISVLFPIWFHRYARSLWAGFDQWHDPRERPDQT